METATQIVNKTELKITLPAVVTLPEYDGFRDLAQTLSLMTNTAVRYRILTNTEGIEMLAGHYAAILYIGSYDTAMTQWEAGEVDVI